MAKRAAAKPKHAEGGAKGYVHEDKEMVARPEVGAAPRFKPRKPPTRYRYDSSLSPALDWDTNPAREIAAFLLACIEDAARLDPPHLFAEQRALDGADGEPLYRVAGLQDAVAALKQLQKPVLNWAGKAERLSFDVPTMPLFVHERLSTAAIIKTLEDHRRQSDQSDLPGLFADPQRPLAEQVRAYEYRDRWVNRMVLGDSLVVMNSLLRFEGLGGQVQMIYIDPPYGVKFGSNFQPFVRKRDVSHGDDADMTREPEMVLAYRDTWQLGLHSYLTYLRDRLLVARDLLTPSGSVFVQISDENLHHVRELMDEVFGAEHFLSVIPFKKTSALGSSGLDAVNDYLIWYARDRSSRKYRQLYHPVENDTYSFTWIRTADGVERRLAREERNGTVDLTGRLFRTDNMTSQSGGDTTNFVFHYQGRDYRPSSGAFWKTNREGMDELVAANRLIGVGQTLAFKRFADDFPVRRVTGWWDDTVPSTFAIEKSYVVQTYAKVVERCLLMTTDPGDLVLDPTCGSGTTAYVAEQWGRRWITVDTSRVPLALARQRLLTATFPWYRLRDESAGPGSGFVYARRQNRKGEEVGGIVPHVTLKSIANNEPPDEEILVDRPEEDGAITRITGPFVVEATLPTPQAVDFPPPPLGAEGQGEVGDSRALVASCGVSPTSPQPSPPPRGGEGASRGAGGITDEPGDHVARMIEVLRRSPTLALPGNRKVTLKSIRRPGRSLSLSAEALVDLDASESFPPPPSGAEGLGEVGETKSRPTSPRPSPPPGAEREQARRAQHMSRSTESESSLPVAILVGPADGPVTAKAVLDAAKEANVKGYKHLFVIGFAITADARADIRGRRGRARRARHLRDGDDGSANGRSAEEPAVQPDFRRVRAPGDRSHHVAGAGGGRHAALAGEAAGSGCVRSSDDDRTSQERR